MIRVVHVITRLTMGGSSENTIAQVVALEQAGYACTLAAGLAESDAATVDDARRRGCRVVDVPGLGREVRPVRDVGALRRLTRLIARERAQIVHTHTSKAGFTGRLAARLARVPAVIHQPHGHIFYGYWSEPRTAFFVRLERLAARWTDRIVTLTERGATEHLAQRIGHPAQYVTVPSGVPTDELRARAPERGAARRRLGLAPEAFVIVAVGRMVPIKGFDVLLAALPRVGAAVPTARLVLVGDGPEWAALDDAARALGVRDRVNFAGAVSSTDALTAHLAAADVCAAPSRNEGMGRALVEAMALGLPVVGTAVGGIPAVIGPDEAGRLVAPDDPAALASALVELGRDAALRRKLGDAARVRAEQFSTRVAHQRLLALYRELVAAKGLA
jgi:glycosyltransferase involved in cell wall biosynthesis